MTRGMHVSLDTVARYCARVGLGSVGHCREWLEREFKARRRVIVNGRSLAGYKALNGTWWCRTNRVAVVFGLTRDEKAALKRLAEARRAPKFPPTMKKLKKGDCVACQGSCKLRVLIEMDADLSWDGKPSDALVAELEYHRVTPRAVTVRVNSYRS